ncbi:T9SS type A sorting domain-containing protein [Chitinophagaceae bacterium MMS25-I14]
MKKVILTSALFFAAFANSFAAGVSSITGTATANAYHGSRLVVDNSIAVNGNGQINGSTGSVSISGFVAGDTLIMDAPAGVTASYNTGTGVITFSGKTDADSWAAAFDNVMYSRSNNNSGDRMIVFSLSGKTFSRTINTVGTLALTWVSFDARTAGNDILLDWKTADEKNTASFDIERSTDGKNFETVGSLNTIGTGNNDYNFTDAATVNGTNYYRLKQIDNDGTFQYSKVITATVRKEAVVDAVVFPNPAKDVLHIKSTVPVSAEIFNLSGMRVAVTEASTETSISLTGLAAGIYVYHLVNGNEVVKMAKIEVIK